MAEGRRRIKMAVNNSWTGYETWTRVFSFSVYQLLHRTNAKLFLFVLLFDSDKEVNDPIHRRPRVTFY